MMRYSSRLFLYGPVVLLLLIAAAVMVWWKIAATSLDARLAADNGREIMPGVRMSYASKSIEGFPFRLDSEMDGFTLQVQMRTGLLTWRAEHFAMHALTYGPNRQVFEAAGTQTLSWTDSEGAHHRYAFVPGSLRASAIISDGRLARFDLDAVAMTSPELSAARLQFHLRRDPARDAIDLAMSGNDVRDLSGERTNSLPDLSVDGTLAPAGPLLELLSGHTDWRSAAESWREHGGRLTFDQIDEGSASGSGALSLDNLHRLQGRVALSYGARESMRQDPTQGELRHLSRQDASGQPELIYLLSNGHIYLNGIPLQPLARQSYTLFGLGLDASTPKFRSMSERNAFVLHPLY
jgi:hypothetical protein